MQTYLIAFFTAEEKILLKAQQVVKDFFFRVNNIKEKS